MVNGMTSNNEINCNISIVDDETNEPIHFKNDGKRFKNDTTLKMLANCLYRFRIHLESVTRQTIPISFITICGNRADYVCKSRENGEQLDISFVWDSNVIEPTEHRKRTQLIIQIGLTDHWLIEYAFQTKFYEKRDSHLVWGMELKNIAMKVARMDELHFDQVYKILSLEFNKIF